MKCENNDCNYQFTQPEESFLCCPKCGTRITRNFDALPPAERARKYLSISSFQQFLQIDTICTWVLMGVVWLVFVMDVLLFLKPNRPWRLVRRQDLYYRSLFHRGYIAVLILLIVDTSRIDQNWMYRLFFKDKLWLMHTAKAKIILAILLSLSPFLLFTLDTKVFLLRRYRDILRYRGRVNITEFIRISSLESAIYAVAVYAVIIYCLYRLWSDWYCRYRCESMTSVSQRRFDRL